MVVPELKMTREELSLAEVLLDTAAEQSLELDFLLPDYEPEVFRLLKTRVQPVVQQIHVNGNRLELGGDRAAALSAMNMGVNLVEVVSLFASSVLAAIGVGWCFALCGALLLSGALVLCRSPHVSPAA